MRPRERRESGEQDLFRSRLDQVINMDHALVKLARTIDWGFLEEKFGAVYADGSGRPPLPTRLMAGLAILKHTYNLSDEVVCEQWIENPYYQYFCGEEFFQHRLPLDRSSMTNWRNRMGEERLQALLQENLVTLAKQLGVELRQSYTRVGKFALIQHQRYAHAKQFKRANRALRTLKTYLGRVIRDITRKIDGDHGLEGRFAHLLSLARRVREQQRGQRGAKVYSLHAPEVECIGKGTAHKPYEFGVKVSVATPLKHSKGGQFIVHAQALPGNPYDGHTLAGVIPAIEQLVGNTIERLQTDAGYRGNNAPPDYKFKIYTSRQKRRVTPAIKREMKRRAAVEPVIGHTKQEHRMGRNYLAHRHGDANNAVLAAAGYNFRRLIRWLSDFLRLLLAMLFLSAEW